MPTVPTRCLPPGELERRPGELERRPMSLLMTEIAVAVSRLAEAGVESPRADAELMAAHRHGVPQSALNLGAHADFNPRFLDHVAPRAGREPMQHHTGTAHLRDVELEVWASAVVSPPQTGVPTG